MLDGFFITTEQKYHAAKQGFLKPNIAITLNDALRCALHSDLNHNALLSRIQKIKFSQLKPDIFKKSINIIEKLEQEAIAFAIFTNIAFLKQKAIQNVHIPEAFLQALELTTVKKAEATPGISYFKALLKKFLKKTY